MADSIHKNHRARTMERYRNEGFSGFSSHEIFEFLLYFSLPRIDTNPAAHELIAEFGSVPGVLNASFDKLCSIPGIGENSAMLIKLTAELVRRYLTEDLKKGIVYDSIGKVSTYLYPLFQGIDHERCYMMMFNNSLGLLDCIQVSSGSVNITNVDTRKMVEAIVNKNASAVILAHNHPNGVTIPSVQDSDLTRTLLDFFSRMNVVLLDHLIFAESRFSCILQKECGNFRTSPATRKIDVGFYERFYGSFEEEMQVSPSLPKVE